MNIPAGILIFREGCEFRQWLESNHNLAPEAWLGFLKKGKSKHNSTLFGYKEAVEIALCYGWIDGLTKAVDEQIYRVRFTPRKPGSTWSSLNIAKVLELTEAGLMHEAGIAAFERRNQKASDEHNELRRNPVFPAGMEERFKKDAGAWQWFSDSSESYRRNCIFWIAAAKKEETQLKRLNEVMDCARNRQRIPLMRSDSGHKKRPEI